MAQLEIISAVEQLRQTKDIRKQIDLILLGMNTIIGDSKDVYYASNPITTGIRMYDVYDKYKICSLEALNRKDPNARYERIIKPNLEDGNKLANKYRKKGLIIIEPGEFYANGWSDEHFMFLWRKVIKKPQVKGTIFNNEDNAYGYSTGCVEEFLTTMLAGKELRGGEDFNLLEPREELKKMEYIIDRIASLGVFPKKLFESYVHIDEEINK